MKKYFSLLIAFTWIFVFAETSVAQQSTSIKDEAIPVDDDNIKPPQPGTLDIEIIRNVRKRQKELDDREKELDRREERLNALNSDIDRQLTEMKAIQARIEEQIKLRDDLKEKSVTKLAKTYASMPPDSAATLMSQIDVRIAIRILSAMKERSAGRILAAATPELATKLSEGMVKRK